MLTVCTVLTNNWQCIFISSTSYCFSQCSLASVRYVIVLPIGISLSRSFAENRSRAIVLTERNRFLQDLTENLKGRECTATCCA